MKKYESIQALPKFLDNVDVASQMPAWNLGLLAACTMVGKDFVAGGVRQLGWHQTLEEYRTTHPAVQGPAVNGVLPPLAIVNKRAAPPMPEIPDIAATAAQSNYYERVSAYYQAWMDAETKILSLILDSLSEDLFRATKDIVNGTGHADRTIEYFVTYLRTNYGGATPTGLKILQEALLQPIRTEAEFAGGITTMMEHFANLARIGQPKSSSDQIEYVTAACIALPNVSKFIRKFKESTDILDHRTVPALLAYLIAKKEFFTSETGGYVGGAALRPSHPSEAALAAARKEGIAAGIAQAEAAARARGGVNKNPHPAGIPKSAVDNKKPRPKYFCFFHGPGHSGSHCKWMAQPENGFTPAQIQCLTPGQVVDGVTAALA